MENTLLVALSNQEARRRQLDVVANNIANANTTAYKQQRVLFQEYLEKPARGEKLSFVQDFGLLRNTQVGDIQITNNPLDIALRGQGYLSVETQSGPRYTRSGNLSLNNDRELVDINGLPVLDDGDARIVIPEGARDITIRGDGTIVADTNQVAKLKVVNFADQQRLENLGGGLLTTEQPPQTVDQPDIVQGALEGSNVQPILETSQMIEILRQYQSTQKLIDDEHQRIRSMVQRLTRVS